MILFLQTNEFLEGLTSGYGIKLVIHYPGTKPLPDDEGLFISAATETNIGLVQVGNSNTTVCPFVRGDANKYKNIKKFGLFKA